MIDKLINSATFGFGASAGRDLYKATKKNPIIWVLIGALLLSFGWRGFYLGFGRSLAYKFFVSFLASLIMVVIGTGCFLFLGIATSSSEDTQIPIMVALVFIGIATISGNIWGWTDRRKRVEAYKINQHNADFLESIGLSDSDFDTNLLQDSEGNLLKLTQQTDEKIVFSVSGRRGLRAAIKLVDGRMLSYTGIVRI